MVIKIVKNFAKEIYADKFKRYLAIGLIVLGILLFVFNGFGKAEINTNVVKNDSNLAVHFFFSPTCPHCAAQELFNDKLMVKYPELNFVYHDVSKAKESALLLEYANKSGIKMSELGVPATFFGEYHILGFDNENNRGKEIESALKKFIEGEKSNEINKSKKEFNGNIKLPLLGEVNVLNYSLPVLAVILGTIDGFNPCAMWVLVYLISLILSINDRRKIWLLVGSFLFASATLYFLFMTAWLNVFLVIGYMKTLTLIIGLFALYIGINDLRTYLKTKGTLECDVGDAESKKKTSERIKKIVESPLTWMTLLGIIGLAFVVNSIEFVCSSALPVIFIQVLTLNKLNWISYYGYILTYLFFFMLDDIIIFGLAAFAVTGGMMGHKYARYCKLIGGVILVILGLVLTFMPDLLSRI